MSELLKKYESLDQSKLNEGTIKILNRVKTITADFTADDAKNNKIAEDVLNEVMKKNPNAVKIVKRTPKAKTAPKKTHKATHTNKGTHTTSSTAKTSNNIMSVTKEIQKAGESWKDAMERAKAVIKERKEKVVQKQKTELEKLYALVKTKKELIGFSKSDIERDAVRTAKRTGARVVTKEGTTSNGYGTFPNKLGRKYWETRDRHADRLAPNYPKDTPLLANGGEVKSVVDALFEFNEKRGKLNTSFGAKTKEGITALIENENYSSEEVAKAIFYSNNKKEKISTGYGDKSFFGLQDMIERARGKNFADGGMMDNMSIHNSADFFNTPVYANGGGVEIEIKGKKHKLADKFSISKGDRVVLRYPVRNGKRSDNPLDGEVGTVIEVNKDGSYNLYEDDQDHIIKLDNGQTIKEMGRYMSALMPEYAKGGGVGTKHLVGEFNEQQLRKGEDKVAIDKAQKETGLTYIESKMIKKSGKPFMQVYLVSNEDYYNSNEFANGGSVNMDKHIWEGWTVGDFIEELEPTFNQIMSGRSWQKPFKTKDEVKAWAMDNQPYYKKNIPEVVNYFWAKVQSKDNYADGGGIDGGMNNLTMQNVLT